MPLATSCPSPLLWWPGWRPGFLTSKCSRRRQRTKEVGAKTTSSNTTQEKNNFSYLTVFPLLLLLFWNLSLPSSGERGLWTGSHDLPPCRFRRTVLLPTWIRRRWLELIYMSYSYISLKNSLLYSSLHVSRFELWPWTCVCRLWRGSGWGGSWA